MSAMGTRDVILLIQRGACADGDRLLTDVEVDEARDLPVREEIAGHAVELADREHPFEDFETALLAFQINCRHAPRCS